LGGTFLRSTFLAHVKFVRYKLRASLRRLELAQEIFRTEFIPMFLPNISVRSFTLPTPMVH
jgi:hypothetical protein